MLKTGTYKSYALRKIDFHFLSNSIECGHGDRFPSDFEPNGILFGSK